MSKAEELEQSKLVVFRGRLAQFGFAYEDGTKAFVRFLDANTSGSVRVSALSGLPIVRWEELDFSCGGILMLKSQNNA